MKMYFRLYIAHTGLLFNKSYDVMGASYDLRGISTNYFSFMKTDC